MRKNDNDNETLPDKSLAKKVKRVMLLEMQKHYEEMDSGLVTECVYFLMELENKKKLPDEEIQQKIDEIPFSDDVKSICDIRKKKHNIKRTILIAAIIGALLAATFTASAIIRNTEIFSNIVEFFDDHIRINFKEEQQNIIVNNVESDLSKELYKNGIKPFVLPDRISNLHLKIIDVEYNQGDGIFSAEIRFKYNFKKGKIIIFQFLTPDYLSNSNLSEANNITKVVDKNGLSIFVVEQNERGKIIYKIGKQKYIISLSESYEKTIEILKGDKKS